jgi:plasmid stabilization system protein ParE
VFQNRQLAGIRSIPVAGFRKYLIFHRLEPDGAIRVLAVVHGARDLRKILMRRR